jgi:hypothetical protein
MFFRRIFQSLKDLLQPGEADVRRETEMVKAFAAEGQNAFPNRLSAWHKAALDRSFTVCSRLLVAQACSLRAAHLLSEFALPAL